MSTYAAKRRIKSFLSYLFRILKKVLIFFVYPIIYPAFYLRNVRLLDVYADRIGHLAVEPEIFLKEQRLGFHPETKTLLLASINACANRCLLKYWRKYFTVISNPMLVFLIRPFLQSRQFRIDVSHYAQILSSGSHYAKIQALYGERAPILSLSRNDEEYGAVFLNGLGISKHSWFVCIHFREEGFIPGEGQTYRNARIETALPAIKAITDQGGWVIRMGDSSMTPLPPMERVIDYAVSSHKSPRLDLILCAKCKFFIGGSSGLSSVAALFGTPVATVNNAPMSMIYLTCRPCDLGISKLVWSTKSMRLLSFGEVLKSKIGNFRYDEQYKQMEVEVIDNSSDEIKDLVLEMMEKLDGKWSCSTDDNLLQERFKSLMNPSHYTYGSASRIGRAFLRKYAGLFSEE